MTWHLLQVSDVLDIEFSGALAESVPLIAWQPDRTLSPFTAMFSQREIECEQTDPYVRVRRFPLLRGYARRPLSDLVPTAKVVVSRLLRQTSEPERSPLILTTPYFAPVAELWPGPVIYWLTDLMAEYGGAHRRLIESLDSRLCRAASLVCPNSARLAEYLMTSAGCDPGKIEILPNATRNANLLSSPPSRPAPLPSDVGDLPRPVVGVIGNLASNMDWAMLEAAVERTPQFSWLFVGPTTMPISDPIQSRARDAVCRHPRARFAGAQPYGKLAAYARSFDVAMLPYRRREPTYSGSSTRFYEHLAACRPMLATRGFEELLHKEPLLRLVDTAEEAVTALEDLRAGGFDDGLAEARWHASHDGTWQVRAATMQRALEQRGPALAREPLRVVQADELVGSLPARRSA